MPRLLRGNIMSLIASLRGPADAAAVSGIATAVLNVLPTALGIIAGVLGIAWYVVLFYDRFIAKGPAADHEDGS